MKKRLVAGICAIAVSAFVPTVPAQAVPDVGWSHAPFNTSPSQEQAVKKAKSYLAHSAFSRSDLIGQLEYSGFSTADAEYAVSQIEASGGVDWNEQAVKKAQSYLAHSAFSFSDLVGQLEYSGFTPQQAQYGASIAYNS